MTPNTSQLEGTTFYKNMTGLLSRNYSFKVYANDSNGMVNVSGTRIVVVNRTIIDTRIKEVINSTTYIINSSIIILSPSTNVTVTIWNGTNATINGEELTWISIDSPAELNSTFIVNLGSGSVLVGENLSLGPEGAQFSPDIQIRFNYTGAQLTASGISASQLRVKFYNTTTNTWVEQTPYTLYQNGSDGYLLVNVSHFNTFSLIGVPAITTTVSSGSSSGGGGGGGGGGVSGEDFSNIILKEKYDKFIYNNIMASFAFVNRSNPISFVNITGNTNAGLINIAIEVLKDTSSLVKSPAPGLVYRNVNIWVGTSGFAVPKNIKSAIIRFRIEDSWLKNNGISNSDVKLFRWDGIQWIQLETVNREKLDSYTYFEVNTNSFSPFAISAKKSGSASAVMPEITQPIMTPAMPNEVSGEVKKSDVSDSAYMMIAIAIVLVVIIVLVINLKKRKKEE
jgi:PGF-pre-PGF domain-containing protein